jgi:PAS domain S-box-containing protein
MTDHQLLPASLAQASQDDDRRLLDADQIERCVRQVLDMQGRERTMHVIQGPLQDAAGQCIGVFGIARDVTEMLQAEQAQRCALEDSRSLLELALSGSELGTWDADLRTGQVRRDDRLLAMLGYGPHDLEPTMEAWRRLLHPEDREAAEAARRAHVDGTTRNHESEHRLRHKDGHWVWVFEAGKVQRDADGQAVRAIGTTRDISGQKRATAESVDLIRRIEQLIGPLRGDPSGGVVPPADAVPPMPHLTGRGRQVLGLLAQGFTAAEIAGRLGITRETANTHRRNLMRQLGLRNKAELIRFALENGLGSPLEGDSL